MPDLPRLVRAVRGTTKRATYFACCGQWRVRREALTHLCRQHGLVLRQAQACIDAATMRGARRPHQQRSYNDRMAQYERTRAVHRLFAQIRHTVLEEMRHAP